MGVYVIAYDVGTTGIKTCIFEIANSIKLVASAVEGYNLYIEENGGAEQNPDELWNAMCTTTYKVIQSSNISSERIQGISFCSQMQGLVLVDRNGEPVRRIMSYMDQRSYHEMRDGIANGIKISGVNIFKLIRSIKITGAVAASVKDPVWKYNWVKCNEPENYKKIYKWLDVKEFLILKCTDQFVMTKDSAFGTMLYDIRDGKNCFSREMCKMLGVDIEHLPDIVNSSDQVGLLTEKAAFKLGLQAGTPVFGGGGDASLIGIGAGASETGDTHIYLGTSGWVSTVVKKRKIDLFSMIASIVGADDCTYNYFAELETAGKCLEWVKDHLALDEINIYLQKVCISDSFESIYKNLYDFMLEEIKNIPAGSHGVIFTPWLHGNRCPFEDSNARGMFFNINLDTGKRDLIHAVIEGICYHLRWQLEAQRKKVNASETIRFVGGGALAPLTCQIISDVLGCKIETVENPQNVGALGAAVIVAVGLGILLNVEEANKMIKLDKTYYPNHDNKLVHDRNYEAFKMLYKNNKSIFHTLNYVE
ncbi:xylulokinase [Sedimentibacter acidaminivorans]|uniref:Xylulokinase n=1 Tax=Sedimentibacter acidaminivorans TaxID=913099 RepID=A0ABS4GH09_9FIRM|nr:FGGY-family carbohydrate kinase [Sedimentibacter acidaminivorans]MBP1926976.1 xylulokinase [Sedimentibacter acidaminivorans]